MSEEHELKRIADSLKRIVHIYEHPEELVGKLYKNLSQTLSDVQAAMPALPTTVGPVMIGTARVEVVLPPEEKEKIIKALMGEIEGQLEDFRGFIAEALSELPEKQLKKIADHLKAGRKFKLRRRPPDCISLDFGYGDEEFQLRL